jgi:hypothetical protein
MNRTITVPCVDQDNGDASYSVKVDYAKAKRLGAQKLGAVKLGRYYYYRADEVDEVVRLNGMEVAQLGAGELDDRGSDYSMWCSVTGKIVKRPRSRVRAALGIYEAQ